ncbi:hypothetical protein [Pseudomonas koreensis]|uniref:hypothetical protein n=1 Tax=Pseudomonas koreensis TaxID=198620 RepID=UPI00320B96E6
MPRKDKAHLSVVWIMARLPLFYFCIGPHCDGLPLELEVKYQNLSDGFEYVGGELLAKH